MNKKAQGEIKIDRYINDLIRNESFMSSMNRLKNSHVIFNGYRQKPSKKNMEKIRSLKKELGDINNITKSIDKRYKIIVNNIEYLKIKNEISKKYFLNSNQIDYIEKLINTIDPNDRVLSFFKSTSELDMCQFIDNNAIETIFESPSSISRFILRNENKLMLNAYPVSIAIHARASQRDVLDYVRKNWKEIESNNLKRYSDKKLKLRTRKHNQIMLDFIWDNKFLKASKIKEKLDIEFPRNGLVNFEITKIIQLEKHKRL